MKWIETGDIKKWITSRQRQSAEILPELIRRLILATRGTIERINFPSGDNIAIGGWDGQLITHTISPFFPSGVSGWEMGIENSPGKKAESDYKKRLKDPQGLSTKETTFVFVTPRSWPERGKWLSKKRSTKRWKDVRVINVDDLELWLESAPAVALWLARQIGKVVFSGGIRDIENVWEEWSLATDPPMTTDLVIGGRTKDVEEIYKWINDKPRILSIQGDSPDEALAFLYASMTTLPETDKAQALARCVAIENIHELRQLTQAYQNPLIIAAPSECLEAAGAAVAKGHHVYLSMDAKVIGLRDILRLSRPLYSYIETSLRKIGFSEIDAQKLSRDFGRSIPVLRRHLFRSGAVNKPIWADVDSAKLLIPVLFACAWTDDKEGDQKVLETLSGMPYYTFTKKLESFLLINDAPIRKVGNVWMLKSPLDTWFLLARHLDSNFLKIFKQIITAVLTQTDPKYDLPTEKRWAANIYGKSSNYSEWLRTGLVESLVILAVYEDLNPNKIFLQSFANNVVNDIFGAAEKWEVWASIKDVTPLLAEASPDAFIAIVEQEILKNPDIFQEIMRDDPGIFGECKHSGLLWAIESVAWDSQYFARAVNILAELAKIDLGGRWHNRPLNSLSHIFHPKRPQTYATPAERLTALDLLIAKDPKIVWKFAKVYFTGGIISESYRFRWRDAGGQRRGLEPETKENFIEYQKGIFPKLINLATAKENLVSALDDFIRLPSEARDSLMTELETINPTIISKAEREKLLQKVREALNWINSYGEQDIRRYVSTLNHVLDRFAPEDVLERVGWLLSTPWPRLPEGEPKEYDIKDTSVKMAQERAAREVLDHVTLDKILEFAASIEHTGVFGYALGKVVIDNEDTEVLEAILDHITDKPELAKGYAQGRVEIFGTSWVDKQIERMKSIGNYSAEKCALLFFGLPQVVETWKTVSLHGKDVENAYWTQVTSYLRVDKSDDALICVEKLLDVKRPYQALNVAGSPQLSLPSLLLQRLLQELLAGKKFQPGVMNEFHLGYVFNQLYERNELPLDEIAKLEWPFAIIFENLMHYTSSPLAIHRVLQKDPTFFVQLISCIYKRDDHSPDPNLEGIDENQLYGIAENAHGVLDSWNLFPGFKEDGSVEEKELFTWVEAVREQCAANHRIRGGDYQIAFMLAHAPSDIDGYWPHIAVRNLIEHLNNDRLDSNIRIGLYNARGIVSRDLTDGGRQERELSVHYKKMSEIIKVKWPRTATILRSLSVMYEQDSKREDVDSDLDELRYG